MFPTISKPEMAHLIQGQFSPITYNYIISLYTSINIVSVCQKQSKLSFYAGLIHIFSLYFVVIGCF